MKNKLHQSLKLSVLPISLLTELSKGENIRPKPENSIKSLITDEFIEFSEILSSNEQLDTFKNTIVEYDILIEKDKQHEMYPNMIYVNKEIEDFTNKLINANNHNVKLELEQVKYIRYSNNPITLLINNNSNYTYSKPKPTKVKYKKKTYQKVDANIIVDKQNRNDLCKCNSGKKFKHCCINTNKT